MKKIYKLEYLNKDTQWVLDGFYKIKKEIFNRKINLLNKGILTRYTKLIQKGGENKWEIEQL